MISDEEYEALASELDSLLDIVADDENHALMPRVDRISAQLEEYDSIKCGFMIN